MIPLGVLGGARHASMTVEYQAVETSPSGTRSYLFTAMPIGTPTATRTVIVGLAWSSSASTNKSSVTVGGITATLDQSTRSGVQRVEFYRAEVPTGSTADVAVAFNSAPNSGVIVATWALDAHVAVVDAAGTATIPLSLSMNTAAGGVALGMTGYAQRGTTDWTGPSERFDLTGASRGSGADMPTNGTPATIAATVTGGPTNPTLIAVTYRRV